MRTPCSDKRMCFRQSCATIAGWAVWSAGYRMSIPFETVQYHPHCSTFCEVDCLSCQVIRTMQSFVWVWMYADVCMNVRKYHCRNVCIVHMYVCLYVCMHVCMCMRTYVRTYTYTHTYIYIYMYYIYPYVNVDAYVSMQVCKQVCIVRMHACMDVVCKYVCK